jgi:hypothetical protein
MQSAVERIGDVGTSPQQRHAVAMPPGNLGHQGDRRRALGVRLQWR